MLLPVDPRSVALEMLPKGAVGAEIGVHTGVFSRKILNTASPTRLYLIDPWLHMADEMYSQSFYGGDKVDQSVMDNRHDMVCRRFSGQIKDGVVKVIRSDSVSAADTFEDDYLDFVYIDGDHSYDGVKADLESYAPKVKKGGLILLDDYTLGNWWGDGVVRPVHEFLEAGAGTIHFKLGNQIAIKL